MNIGQTQTLRKLDQRLQSGQKGYIETQYGDIHLYPVSNGFFAEFIDANNVKVSAFDTVPSVAFLKVAERIKDLNEISAETETESNLGICLHDHKGEFKEALQRGFGNEFELFDGWDKDTFFVINRTNQTEYKVEFETVNGKTNASCECKDFIHRQRICKHIAFTLVETFYSVVLN